MAACKISASVPSLLLSGAGSPQLSVLKWSRTLQLTSLCWCHNLTNVSSKSPATDAKMLDQPDVDPKCAAGPNTLIGLGKGKADKAALVKKLVPHYKTLLEKLKGLGVKEVQLHEPILVTPGANKYQVCSLMFSSMLQAHHLISFACVACCTANVCVPQER